MSATNQVRRRSAACVCRGSAKSTHVIWSGMARIDTRDIPVSDSKRARSGISRFEPTKEPLTGPRCDWGRAQKPRVLPEAKACNCPRGHGEGQTVLGTEVPGISGSESSCPGRAEDANPVHPRLMDSGGGRGEISGNGDCAQHRIDSRGARGLPTRLYRSNANEMHRGSGT
jgi:hypothetical protein